MMTRLAFDPTMALRLVGEFARPFTVYEVSEVMATLRRGVLPELLRQLGQGHTPSERLYPADSDILRSCDLHHAFQAGLRALGQERQDGSREGRLESRTARQRGLRVYRSPRYSHEPQGHHVQRPHGTVHGPSRVSHHACCRSGHPQMVQYDTACTAECPTSNSLQPCTQRFSLTPNLPSV